MKYYKIEIQKFYEDRIASAANGKNVSNKEDYFYRIRKGEILCDTPIFDYFVLESFDKEKYWEWMLFDVHSGIGEYPFNSNWYISNKLKKILTNFIVSPEYCFYETNLLYKEEKLKYWIFQFVAPYRKLNKMKYISFEDSLFISNSEKLKISNLDEFDEKNDVIEISLKKIHLSDYFDFIPLSPITSDIIVSERLKKVMEENEITGFEFSELDYEVITENSNLC